jgi:integrase
MRRRGVRPRCSRPSYGPSRRDHFLLTYRQGLRAAEVCDLRWDQVDFAGAVLHVRRVKNGTRAPTRSKATSCGRPAGSGARARHRQRSGTPFTTAVKPRRRRDRDGAQPARPDVRIWGRTCWRTRRWRPRRPRWTRARAVDKKPSPTRLDRVLRREFTILS